MKNFKLLLYIIIIIIGGVIIIIIGGRGPFPPEPECLVCGRNLDRFIGISLVAIGAGLLYIDTQINKQNIKG